MILNLTMQKKLAEELIPAYISENLDKNNQVKDYLLRQGDLDSLKKTCSNRCWNYSA